MLLEHFLNWHFKAFEAENVNVLCLISLNVAACKKNLIQSTENFLYLSAIYRFYILGDSKNKQTKIRQTWRKMNKKRKSKHKTWKGGTKTSRLQILVFLIWKIILYVWNLHNIHFGTFHTKKKKLNKTGEKFLVEISKSQQKAKNLTANFI